MPSVTLEAPDTTPEESHVEESPKAQETSETGTKVETSTTTEAPSTETPAETEAPSEALVELDGEKIPVSQVKKWKEDYGRDSKWIQKNQRESEELNRIKRELEPLQVLKPYLEQRPELLQQLFAPPKKRDFDSELRQLYTAKPDPLDVNASAQWEYQKDLLIAERASEAAKEQAMMGAQAEIARRENLATEQYGVDTYVTSGKLSPDEYKQLLTWVVGNLLPKNGRYSKEQIDGAYRELFRDKWIGEMKIETAKKVVAPLTKVTKGGSETGKAKQIEPKTQADEDDDNFVGVVRQKRGKNWMSLPAS